MSSASTTSRSNPVGGTAANTIIDATGETYGITSHFNGAIKNLTIRNAEHEGIQVSEVGAVSVTDFTVSGNIVADNDQCMKHPTVSG